MDIERLKRDITRREGLRLELYDDHLGFKTIGVGRCIELRGISEATAMQMLDEDINIAVSELKQNLSWFDDMPETVQECLVDLAFNMGVPKLMKFKITLGLLEAHQFKEASAELLRSQYASQVPNRAIEIAELIAEAGE